MFAWLANQVILCPSKHPIEVDEKDPLYLDTDRGKLEIWVQQVPATLPQQDSIFIVKFLGTGGRAERAGTFPADAWPESAVEIWTPNPFGYGGSEGKASLDKLRPMAEAVYDAVRNAANGRRILVTGNSLGNLSALYLAARYPIDGLILRNPPPLQQTVLGRYPNWLTAGVSGQIAKQIPSELDAIANAKDATCPAFFVSSAIDRVVPTEFQKMVIDAYQGPKQVLVAEGADHADPVPETQMPELVEGLRWVKSQPSA